MLAPHTSHCLRSTTSAHAEVVMRSRLPLARGCELAAWCCGVHPWHGSGQFLSMHEYDGGCVRHSNVVHVANVGM